VLVKYTACKASPDPITAAAPRSTPAARRPASGRGSTRSRSIPTPATWRILRFVVTQDVGKGIHSSYTIGTVGIENHAIAIVA
jgi:hypothetical protein